MMPLKLGKKDITQYYYTLCIKSASLYVPAICFGLVGLESQNGQYMVAPRLG